MSRKIKEVEGQKSPDKFLKAVIKHTPSDETISRLVNKTKKQTPPSAEKRAIYEEAKLRSRRHRYIE